MAKPFNIPPIALWLGLGGWIPFWVPVALSAQALISGRSAAAEEMAFTIYAGLILSFLGGVRWGGEIVRRDPPDLPILTASILPSLGALAAAFIHWAGQPMLAWAALATGFWIMLVWDRRSVRQMTLPKWFGALRLILTCGVFLSCLAMAAIYSLSRS